MNMYVVDLCVCYSYSAFMIYTSMSCIHDLNCEDERIDFSLARDMYCTLCRM